MKSAAVLPVYILEDDLFFCQLLKVQVEKFFQANQLTGEIFTFSNGEDFLKQYNGKASLIFLDYLLGDENSEEVLKKIYEVNKKQKVVMLSGQDDGSTTLRLIRMGIRHYIIKDDDYINNLQDVMGEEFADEE